MTPTLHVAVLLAFAIALTFYAPVAVSDSTTSLYVLSPTWAVGHYPAGCPTSSQGCTTGAVTPNTPALFGMPLYGGGLDPAAVVDMSTYTYLGSGTSAKFACQMIDPNSNGTIATARAAGFTSIIALVTRSTPGVTEVCDFSAKVLNVETSGLSVSAVIVVNDESHSDQGYASILPYMIDTSGRSVGIPSMLVDYQNGKKLVQDASTAVSSNTFLLMSMEWFLPNPDGRVEYALFSDIYDPKANSQSATSETMWFRSNFGNAARPLGSTAQFTPYLRFNNQTAGFCYNNKKYCYFGLTPSSSVSRQQVLEQGIVQMVLWSLLNQRNVTHNLFSYYEAFYSACTGYTLTCTQQVIDSLNAGGGATNAWSQNSANAVSISSADVLSAMGASSWSSINFDQTFAAVDMCLDAWNDFEPVTKPVPTINGYWAYGSLTCPLPITLNTCALLTSICSGFAVGTVPAACTGPEDCPFGQTKDQCGICNGNDSCLTTEGITIGEMFAFVIGIFIIIGLIVYCCVRRSNNSTRQDVDLLLQQYMAKNNGLGSAPTKKQVKTAQRESLINTNSTEEAVMMDE